MSSYHDLRKSDAEIDQFIQELKDKAAKPIPPEILNKIQPPVSKSYETLERKYYKLHEEGCRLRANIRAMAAELDSKNDTLKLLTHEFSLIQRRLNASPLDREILQLNYENKLLVEEITQLRRILKVHSHLKEIEAREEQSKLPTPRAPNIPPKIAGSIRKVEPIRIPKLPVGRMNQMLPLIQPWKNLREFL